MPGGHRLCADRSEAKTGGIPMAGRKPKPTALKKLEGNPGKRKLNAKEPVPAKGMPDCLKWLNHLHFCFATIYILGLQLSTFLFYYKQIG
jgi:hypothetical protein